MTTSLLLPPCSAVHWLDAQILAYLAWLGSKFFLDDFPFKDFLIRWLDDPMIESSDNLLILAIFLQTFQISRLCEGSWLWRSSASQRLDWKPKGGRTSWRDTLQLECTGILNPWSLILKIHNPEDPGSPFFSSHFVGLIWSNTAAVLRLTRFLEISPVILDESRHCRNFHNFVGHNCGK